jgi:hypothetical protein
MGGGPFDFGTVFKLKPPAPGQTQWTETVLLGFGSPTAGLNIDSKDPAPRRSYPNALPVPSIVALNPFGPSGMGLPRGLGLPRL